MSSRPNNKDQLEVNRIFTAFTRKSSEALKRIVTVKKKLNGGHKLDTKAPE